MRAALVILLSLVAVPVRANPTSVAASEAADAAPSPDAAEPARDTEKPGPWAVGVRTVRLTDPTRNRQFAVDVWYRVDPAHVDGSPNRYELDSLFGTLASIDSPARRNATPAAGAWPLVLFSHGHRIRRACRRVGRIGGHVVAALAAREAAAHRKTTTTQSPRSVMREAVPRTSSLVNY